MAGEAPFGGATRPSAAALPVSRLVLTVMLPFGLGYYLSYLYRTMNAVIAPQLMAEVGLTAADLGFLTSVYFIAFAAVQLPLGVLLDRFGPRRVQAALLLVAALGGFLFAVGGDFAALSVARAFIGLGVSACFMSVLKANAIWWPAERLPLVNNITASFGSFGALSATVPVEALLGVMGWRAIFAAIAAGTVVLAALVYFVVPEKPGGPAPAAAISAQAGEVAAIYRDRFFWRIGFMLVMFFAVYIAYQTLWAGPWLRDVAGLSRDAVANHLFLIQLGMFAGLVSTGLAADFLRRAGISPMVVVGFGGAAFLLVQLLLVLRMTAWAAPLWAGFGFFGAVLFLFFSIYSQHYPTTLTGRVNTAINMVLFVLTFVVQWGVGAMMDLWPGLGEGRYPAAAHSTALAVMLALECAAFAWFLWPGRRRG